MQRFRHVHVQPSLKNAVTEREQHVEGTTNIKEFRSEDDVDH